MSAPKHGFTFDPSALNPEEGVVAIDLIGNGVLDSGILIITRSENEPGDHLGFQGTVFLDERAGELTQPMPELAVEGRISFTDATGYFSRRP
jgi:hypothetical protein